MELDEGDAYAAAALFTLALHQSQMEVGVGENGQLLSESQIEWGCPKVSDIDELLEHPEILAQTFERFWGWDSCGPNGICRQTYKRLGIPECKWVGLLRLPGLIGDFSSRDGVGKLVDVVQMYGGMLDPELEVEDEKAQRVVQDGQLSAAPETMDMATIPSDAESTDNITPRRSSTDGSGDGVDPGNRTYFEQDVGVSNSMEADKVIKGSNTPDEQQESEGAGSSDSQDNTERGPAEDPIASCDTPDALITNDLSHEGVDSPADKCTVSTSCSASLTTVSQTHHATAKSCAVLQVLLEACIGEFPVVNKKSASKKGLNVLEGFEVKGQWYDARSRVAIYRVLYWLKVPVSTMEAFETNLASSLLTAQKEGVLKPAQHNLIRWAKVGAVAIGGGAAIALTGGLAAPAIAAGLGSAVSLVGGSAATASAISGFAASTAGTATITSAFGAYGASQTGGYMARRTANVKEFGFWDVSEVWEDAEMVDQEMPPKKPTKTSKLKFWTSKKSFLKKKSESTVREGEKNGKDGDPEIEKKHSSPSSATNVKEPILSSTAESSDAPCKPGASSSENDVPEIENQPPEQTDNENIIAAWLKSWLVTKDRRPLYPLPVNPKHSEWKLNLVICITGWLQQYEDFLNPWTCLSNASTDRFALVWEAKELKEVGDGLMAMIKSQVATEGAKWFIKKYFYTGLLSAVAIPLLLLTLTSMTIDNKWAIAQQRASKAGELLAQCLADGLHGHRPVTLIGFSLGSRLIYHCLLELSRLGKVGIVENVIMLGTPVGLNHRRWTMVRGVVAGRFVNGYSSKDWVLGITYRASQGFIRKAAGCCPVEIPGIENVDLSNVIGKHTDYLSKMPEICEILNIRTSR